MWNRAQPGVGTKSLSSGGVVQANFSFVGRLSIAETQPQLQPALLRLSAMISQYFFRHQGVAPYESEDAPGKEKPTRPLTSRNLKITLRSHADTVSSRKVKRENALKAALPGTPGSHEQTGVRSHLPQARIADSSSRNAGQLFIRS